MLSINSEAFFGFLKTYKQKAKQKEHVLKAIVGMANVEMRG